MRAFLPLTPFARTLSTVLTLGLVATSFLLGQSDDRPVEDAKKVGVQLRKQLDLPAIWLIGDSTVRVGTKGQRGWGDELTPYFDTTKVQVVNRALGGRSSRTYLTGGLWESVLAELRAGDIVIMQFGHNDPGPLNEPPPVTSSTRARGTIKGNGEETQEVQNVLTGKPEVVHSYGWYLRQFITTAKAKGATLVVCSPIPHKSWTPEGKVKRASNGYGKWAREAAEQEGALFIDLNDLIATGYEEIGPAAVEPFFADKGTHTSREGAKFNARSVVAGLNRLAEKNPAASLLSAEGRAVSVETLAKAGDLQK
ncbi:rhamnogalacturonan acetylesterase [Verrucomicrobium sp. BvORR106]|uniref:rhamnogalacturonan acetylesterase n=1 Tax=Verrucomicrobium sp. BvORR106 TaxID=1403819 RepID=UPI0009E080B0|nr:rhamnogalacturonan acetylesterase [Verrucomicrobium sp. BvORR106]